MNSILSIGQSGLQAAQMRLNTAAHNVANLNTENFARQTLQQQAIPQGGVRTVESQQTVAGSNLEDDVVQQMLASYSYKANLQTIAGQQRMTAALLDMSTGNS